MKQLIRSIRSGCLALISAIYGSFLAVVDAPFHLAKQAFESCTSASFRAQLAHMAKCSGLSLVLRSDMRSEGQGFRMDGICPYSMQRTNDYEGFAKAV